MDNETHRPIDTLIKQLYHIITHIDEGTRLLRKLKKISGNYARKSDIGWLISMLDDDAGTLFAVKSGIRAREWDELIHELEERLILLRVDQRLKEQEIDQLLRFESVT